MTLVFAGMTTLDLVHRADVLPGPGDKQEADSSYVDVGGPAANAAITASTLGGAAVLLSIIGRGPVAEYAARVLDEHGVATVDYAGLGVQPPLASIWVDGAGERAILSTGNSSVEVVVPASSLLPEEAAVVLVDGHYPELARASADDATRAGIPVVLDCGRWRPVYTDLLPVATEVIMCETFRPPGFESLAAADAVTAISAEWNLEVCAITRGPADILAVDAAGLHAIPVPQVDAIDTMGAGDVLHGAFVYYRYHAGMAPLEALDAAAAVASQSCAHLGARVANPG